MVSTLLSVFTSAVSAILSGISAVFEGATEHPKATLGIIAGFLVWSVGAYSGYWYRGTQIPDRDQVFVEWGAEPGKLERLLGGTKPDRAKRGKAPDSSNTDTVRVVVPTYLPVRDTVFKPQRVGTASIPYNAPDVEIDAHLGANPYGFLLLPTPDGRPSVTVSAHQTRIRALDPRDGAEVQLGYDHPEETFGFGPLVRGSYTRTGTQAKSGGVSPFRWVEATVGAWAKYRAVRLDGGFRLSQDEPHGWTVGIEWTPDVSDL